MKNKCLLLVVLVVISSNIFGQLLTFPNADIFTTNLPLGYDITSNDTIVIVATEDEDNSDLFTVEKGELEFLRPLDCYFRYSEGNLGIIQDEQGGIWCTDLVDVYSGEIIADFDEWTVWSNWKRARKGDTLVFYAKPVAGLYSHCQLKIGENAPIEMNILDDDLSASDSYYITNDTMFVYTQVGDYNGWITKIYAFPFNDLNNPVIHTIYDYKFYIYSFLDDKFIVRKTDNNNQNNYYYLVTDENNWQEIDQSIFGDTWYTLNLSYYDYNGEKELLISGINPISGDIIQIYTEGLPSAENDILTFSFPEQTANAVINSTNHTVNVEVANGTNLTNLIASFTLSEGATAYVGGTLQQSGVTENDFTNSVIYTIHAENAETQTWTVNVTEAQLNDQNDILTFSFPEQTANAVINSTNKTVDIQVANGTILTNLVASFTLSAGATAYIGGTLQQSGVTQNDFTNSVIYTIQAENGETLTWTINVVVETSIQTTDNSQLSIYPNPTSGLLKIETAQTIKKVTISDLSGRIIKTTNRAEFDVSDLPNGQYFIQIETETGTTTHKILINK